MPTGGGLVEKKAKKRNKRNEKDTNDEEVRLEFDNPNASISFHKLLVEAGYKFKQVDIVTRPEWAKY